MKPKTVEDYLENGCGRSSLGETPECKVRLWAKELRLIHEIVLDCGLNGEIKWGVPVYTWNRKNIVLIGGFKENCVLSFFKGALLKDELQILEKPGENTQAGRLIRFKDFKQIIEKADLLKSYIFEAIEVEKAGLKVTLKKTEEYDVPIEFAEALEANPALRKAFEKLTPGRQRAYLLHFSQAKQAKTRIERIQKYIPKILEGKGVADW